MRKVQTIISLGTGIAIVSKLPTKKFNEDELKQICWVLSSMIARPVAQSYDGRLLYEFMTQVKRLVPARMVTLPTKNCRGIQIMVSNFHAFYRSSSFEHGSERWHKPCSKYA